MIFMSLVTFTGISVHSTRGRYVFSPDVAGGQRGSTRHYL